MITDKQLELGEIAIPNAGNTDSDEFDFQAAKVAFGGGQIFLNAMVTEDGVGGTSTQVKLLDATAAGGSYGDRILSKVVDLADIKVGLVMLSVSLPPDIKRAVKVNVIGTGAFSAGKVKFWLSGHPLDV